MEKKAEKARMQISRAGISNKRGFTPLESPAIYSGGDIDEISIPYRKGGVKAPSFLTGFTLLELIVVLFIISLVMALILPSFSGFGENKLKSESREMASILRYMNDSAASRKETFLMRFDLDEGKVYWKGPDGEKTKRFDDITGVTTQSRGRVSNGEVIVFFEPLGIQENLSVHMSKDKKDMTITLNHLSGKVKITGNAHNP
jgi:prepilin-type N-terminal cleavage/methylation domain-containing protein